MPSAICLGTVGGGVWGRKWITGSGARGTWDRQGSPIHFKLRPRANHVFLEPRFCVPPFPTLLPHAASWRTQHKERAKCTAVIPGLGVGPDLPGSLPREAKCKSQTTLLSPRKPRPGLNPQPCMFCTESCPSPPETSFVKGASQPRVLFFLLCPHQRWLKWLCRSSVRLRGPCWTSSKKPNEQCWEILWFSKSMCGWINK